MSHEPSFRRSSQALTAALIVISCLIIVPGIRSLSSCLPWTQAQRDSVQTAQVHEHLQVAYSEFYPNVGKIRKSNGVSQTTTTVKQSRSVSREQSLAVADQKIADSSSVDVIHSSPSTPGAPHVTVPVTVNVNNGELVSELMRIHHRISDAQDTQDLFEQSTPATNSSVSASTAVPRVFQYEVHGVASTNVQTGTEASRTSDETKSNDKVEKPASVATIVPVVEDIEPQRRLRQSEKMRLTPRKQTAQIQQSEKQKPTPTDVDFFRGSDIDSKSNSSESSSADTTEGNSTFEQPFAAFEALQSPEIKPRTSPERTRAQAVEPVIPESLPNDSIQIEPSRQQSVRTEHMQRGSAPQEFVRPVSKPELAPTFSTPPENLPVVLLPAELLPAESLPEFAMPENTTSSSEEIFEAELFNELSTGAAPVDAQRNEPNTEHESIPSFPEIEHQSGSLDHDDLMIARPPAPIPSIPALKREQKSKAVDANDFSMATPSTSVPAIPIPQRIQQTNMVEVVEAVVAAPSTPVPPVPVPESIQQASFRGVETLLAAVPQTPVPPVPVFEAMQEFEGEANDQEIVFIDMAQPSSPVPPVPDLALIQQTSGIHQDDLAFAQPSSPVPPVPDLALIQRTSGIHPDDLVFVQADSPVPPVPVPDWNFQQSSNSVNTVIDPQFQIPIQHDIAFNDKTTDESGITEEPTIALIPPIPDLPITDANHQQSMGHQIASDSRGFEPGVDEWTTNQSSSAAVRYASRFSTQNTPSENPVQHNEAKQNPWNSISQRLAKVVNGESRLHKVPGHNLHKSQHQYGKQAHVTPDRKGPSNPSPAGPSIRTAIVNNVQAFNQRVACTLESMERTQLQTPEWLVRLPDSDPLEPVRQSPTLHRVTSAVRFATKPKALR